jgi:hypothetical protein
MEIFIVRVLLLFLQAGTANGDGDDVLRRADDVHGTELTAIMGDDQHHKQQATTHPPLHYFEQLRRTVSSGTTDEAASMLGAPLIVADAATLQCIEQQQARGWDARRRELPLFILALGTEGTGHHAVESFLRGLSDKEYKTAHNDVYRRKNKHYTVRASQSLSIHPQ